MGASATPMGASANPGDGSLVGLCKLSSGVLLLAVSINMLKRITVGLLAQHVTLSVLPCNHSHFLQNAVILRVVVDVV